MNDLTASAVIERALEAMRMSEPDARKEAMTMPGKRNAHLSSRRSAFPRKDWAAPHRCASGDELASARWFRNRRSLRPSQVARHSDRHWASVRLVFGRRCAPGLIEKTHAEHRPGAPIEAGHPSATARPHLQAQFNSTSTCKDSMKLRQAIALFLLASIGTFAHAAKWATVAGNPEVSVFVDVDSIRRDGDQVRTWLKWQWNSPQNVPDSYPPKTYLMERQLQVSDCRQGTLAIAQGVRYSDKDGVDAVSSYAVDQKHWQFSDVVPETIGETIVQFACKRPVKRRQ